MRVLATDNLERGEREKKRKREGNPGPGEITE